jgi:hypothetical protein
MIQTAWTEAAPDEENDVPEIQYRLNEWTTSPSQSS